MLPGQSLVDTLRANHCPAYARTLPPVPAPVPAALKEVQSLLQITDIAALLEHLLSDEKVTAALHLRYLSGPLDDLRQPRDANVSAFLADLFHHIVKHHKSTRLAGWDLFHAHLFVNGSELGLLFHAHEYPEEYTAMRRIHAVGSTEAGGTRDPRIGTELTVSDPAYTERNFLWLRSTNTITLLLPAAPTFPTAELLSPHAAFHFATVDEAAFGRVVADVNYLQSPPTEAADPNGPPRPELVTVGVYAPFAEALSITRPKDPTACVPAVEAVANPHTPGHDPDLAASTSSTEEELELMPAYKRMRQRTSQLDATLRFERLLRTGVSHSELRAPGHWVVLIGGEFGGVMRQDAARTRPGAWLGAHTSLQSIGRAFEALLPTVSRERIIVVAQVRETLEWLESACASDKACECVAGAARFRPMLLERLANTRRDCAMLLRYGGADYDSTDVNAATVLRVLSGDAAAMGGRPVIPPQCTSVHILLYSHGNAHPRDAAKPNVGLDEHYMHFPYPVPPDAEALYDGVAWKGDAKVDELEPYGEPRKFRWRLYSTMLFRSLLHVHTAHPHRTTVVLNQSCLSAGHARFLEQPAFQAVFRTQSWPVLLVSTAGPWEASIGDFWELWLEEWGHALNVPAAHTTLGDVYARAEARYWERNRSLKEHNDNVATGAPAFTPLTFGTVHLHEGRGKQGQPMRETVVWDLVREEEVCAPG